MRRNVLLVALAPLLVIVALTGAGFAGTESLEFEDLLAWRLVREVTVSADGGTAVFALRETNREANRFETHLWAVPVTGGEARRYTRGPGDQTSPRLSPDGTTLAFLSTNPVSGAAAEDGASSRPRASAGEPGPAQLWVMPVDGGAASPLTALERGVRDLAWAPDGEHLYFTTSRAVPVDDVARDRRLHERGFDAVEVDADPDPIEIWRVSADGGQAERVYAGKLGLGSIRVSPDGGRIAFTANGTGRRGDERLREIWVLDLADGSERRLTDRPGPENGIAWSPDGAEIAFLGLTRPSHEYGQSRLFRVPLAGGEPVDLVPDLDRAVESFAWLPGDDGLVLTVADGPYTRLVRLDPVNGGRTTLLGGEANCGDVAVAADAGTIVFTDEGPEALPDVYALARHAAAPWRVTDLNPELADFRLAPQHSITWSSDDGLTIGGVLTLPPDRPEGEPVPLIVNPHGGPYGRTRNVLTGGVGHQVLAAHGYAVLQPNFRGSSGYGADFDAANIGDIGGGDYRDIMAGVDALIERGVADPERLGVVGGSYGGYMTNWIITHTNRFDAAVSMFGLWSLLTDFSNSDIPRWEYHYLGDWYWNDLDTWLEHSPGFHAAGVTTPVLILHGQADENTFIANSNEMYAALREMGKTVKYVTYPREGHGIGREPAHVLDRQRRTLEWLDEYVR